MHQRDITNPRINSSHVLLASPYSICTKNKLPLPHKLLNISKLSFPLNGKLQKAASSPVIHAAGTLAVVRSGSTVAELAAARVLAGSVAPAGRPVAQGKLLWREF